MDGTTSVRAAKKQKTNRFEKTPGEDRICPFSLLNKDALYAVLLRTRASDHKNLVLCCKRFRLAIYSKKYKKARSELGWAEVSVELTPQEEPDSSDSEDSIGFEDRSTSYDSLGKIGKNGEHVFDTTRYRVFVDTWPLHKKRRTNKRTKRNFKLKMHLLPRNEVDCVTVDNFYQMCDIVENSDLDYASRMLLDHEGNIRSGCLEKAIPREGYWPFPFLYIEQFELPIEYRSPSSTVGPLILQKILKTLFMKFSFAIYFPSGEAQDLGDEVRGKNKVEEKNRTLMRQDMRRFFRAGFRQVDDFHVVHDKQNIVFITVVGIPKSILTEQQALGLPIASPRDNAKTGLAKYLYKLLTKRCPEYSKLVNRATGPLMMNFLEKLNKRSPEESKQSTTQECDDTPDCFFMGHFIPGTKNVNADRFFEKTIREIHDILSKSEDSFEIILDSNIIHVCAAYEYLRLIDFFLDYLPDRYNEAPIVLNNPDEEGLTPLMFCARKMYQRDLSPRDAKKSLDFVRSFIGLGADKDKVHEKSGLSACGFFRHGVRELRSYRYGHDSQGLSKELREVADQIEKALTPSKGRTDADRLVIGRHELDIDDGDNDSDDGDNDSDDGDNDSDDDY